MLIEPKNPGLQTEPSVTLATPNPAGHLANRDPVDDTEALYPVRAPAQGLSLGQLMAVSDEERQQLARPRA